MFKIEKPKDPIKWPISVRIPQDGGKVKKSVFIAHLIFLTQAEYNQVFDDNPTDGDAALVRKVLVGWGETGNTGNEEDIKNGIVDAEGNPLKFNPENLETVIDIGYFRSSVVTDYIGFMRGQATTKN